eukprot:jgi/Tetstr1/438907/TSEL_027415.t1
MSGEVKGRAAGVDSTHQDRPASAKKRKGDSIKKAKKVAQTAGVPRGVGAVQSDAPHKPSKKAIKRHTEVAGVGKEGSVAPRGGKKRRQGTAAIAVAPSTSSEEEPPVTAPGSEDSDEPDSQQIGDGSDAEEPGGAEVAGRSAAGIQVEGLVIDEELYFLDKNAKAVFSANQDKAGKLVQVGWWDAKSRTMTPLKEPAEAPVEESNDNDDSSEDEDPKNQAQAPKKSVSGARRGTAQGLNYPFAVNDDDDHCETSPEAYADVEHILGKLADKLGKTRAELKIYDPYFCTGQVVNHLGQYGFADVYNRCEDFYQVIANGEVPEHDVVVTNPPYSADHMEKIIRFCTEQAKPWMLLLPNYVYMKDYFEPALRAGPKPVMAFYIAPTQRYYYWSPKGMSRDNPKVRGDGRTSPFISFWYCHMGRFTEDICQWWNKTLRGEEGPKGRRVVLARSTRQLPLGVMDEADPNRVKKKLLLDRGAKARDKANRGRGRGRGRGGRFPGGNRKAHAAKNAFPVGGLAANKRQET